MKEMEEKNTHKQTLFVTFGELLLRFSKPAHYRLTQGNTFASAYGGSEANVAVSLATLGETVNYVTRLPDSPVGHAGAMRLRELGVGTRHILYGNGRMGSYYFEDAVSVRRPRIVYDREGSAYSLLRPGMINWRNVLSDATVLCVSGITAAISQQAADATMEALDVAEEMGLTVAFDMNYRKNLWRYPGADPRGTLCKMLRRADIVFGDVVEFEFLSGHSRIPFEAVDAAYQMPYKHYEEWFAQLHDDNPRCKRWLMGIRNEPSATHHTLTALLYVDGQMYKSKIMDIHGVADPMGVGDAFMAAFLHATAVNPADCQWTLDYSLAAATLKNSINGDFNLSTDEEILTLLQE